MNDQRASSKIITDTLTYLFDGQSHPLAVSLEKWLSASRRFSSFVNTFRDKIRKKLRVTQAQDGLYNLRLELETAYLLLQERSLSVVYEPQLGQIRHPDFAVSFTTSLTFMVEVTRMQAQTLNARPISESLADTICSKLGQLLPQQSNVLIVGLDTSNLTQADIQGTMLRLQQRAERSDATFWQQYEFRDRADFFRHYQRLSEVLVRRSELQAGEPVAAWINSQAKHPLPAKVRTVLHRSHTA